MDFRTLFYITDTKHEDFLVWIFIQEKKTLTNDKCIEIFLCIDR